MEFPEGKLGYFVGKKVPWLEEYFPLRDEPINIIGYVPANGIVKAQYLVVKQHVPQEGNCLAVSHQPEDFKPYTSLTREDIRNLPKEQLSRLELLLPRDVKLIRK